MHRRAAAALLLVLLPVLVAGCASATVSPASSFRPVDTVPGPTISPVGLTPAPSGAADAAATVKAYIDALIRGDMPGAWAMLGAEAQSQIGSFADYSSERTAYFASVNGQYQLLDPANGPDLAKWLTAGAPASADMSRAFAIEVDYPALAGNNAGYEVYLAAPEIASGTWRIWPLR
jgi:hypothetical protein